jgi:hypothetical protein
MMDAIIQDDLGPENICTFQIYRKTPYLVLGTTWYYIFFFSMVVPGTKCSQKIF